LTRGCHGAIEAIYWTLNGPRAQRLWVLDADLSAAFDRTITIIYCPRPARSPLGGWSRNG